MQLAEIQSRLFDVGSNIATPEATSGEMKLQRVRCVVGGGVTTCKGGGGRGGGAGSGTL